MANPGRIGDLKKVPNKKPRGINTAAHYFHVRVQEEGGKEHALLLTEHEIQVAKRRAHNNPEDVLKPGVIRDFLD